MGSKKEASLSKLYRELNNPLHYYAYVVLLLRGVEVNKVNAFIGNVLS